ncbi:MAG: enoyl-CoA hydratase/isomerase family protein [Acidimicrobiales bacterium]|nr:enoyl-CoA hydratase/isomerase family protein [Acidimicrobiales bacterium]
MTARTIDTGTDHLTAEIGDGVAVLTMNRPDRRNAMSSDMLAGMQAALQECATAPDVRCVVLTGAGGAFCAGGDVKGMAEGSSRGEGTTASYDERVHQQRLDQRATSGALWSMPKPTIAALPGAAAGAGLSLALACDLRVAVRGAVMTSAFARVGFSGDYGGTWFLTQLVGPAKAKELYYLSSRIDMVEAERLGLVNAVFDADGFEAGWRAMAQQLATGPSIAYRFMKENINRAALGGDLMDCMDLEVTHHLHCGQTEDHLNAAQAFVDKREPTFQGR